jgi:hypothetical protein
MHTSPINPHPYLDSQGGLSKAGILALQELREDPRMEALRLWLGSQKALMDLPQQWTPDSWLVHSCQHEAKKLVVKQLLDMLNPQVALVRKGYEDEDLEGHVAQ